MNDVNFGKYNNSRNAFKTLFTCAVLGPPAGLVLLLFYSQISWISYEGLPQFADMGARIAGFLLFLIFAIPFSYFAGGIYGIITGVIYAIYGRKFGQLPIWLGVITGFFTFSLSHLLFQMLLKIRLLPGSFFHNIILSMASEFSTKRIFVHVGAAVFCWWFAQRFWLAKAI